jgi:hypothetical protein
VGLLALLDEDPYQLLRHLRETDPVCWVPELNARLVNGHAVPRGLVFRKPPELHATWEVS